MICGKCQILGVKSTINVDHNMMSCLVLHHHNEFYDEDGKHHFHENVCNQNLDTATCSNNHRWQIIKIAKCNNCDWVSSTQDPVIWLNEELNTAENDK